MQDLPYLIWLCETARLPTVKINKLLAALLSGEAVYNAPVKELQSTCPLNQQELRRLKDRSLRGAQKILSDCKRLGVEILSQDHPLYPDRLKNIYDPPILLYLRGKMPDLNIVPSITIVGTRKGTPYGVEQADRLGASLARKGLVVVSGMAEGIDSAAQVGALKGGGITVAVFGTAINICYPAFNVRLMRDILQNGALLSEYPPDAQTGRSSFPRRNRIMSGLTLGTVVVEADEASGSLITANYALNQGREVFAVPGNVGSPFSKGTNELMKDGARPVTCAEDITDALGLQPTPETGEKAKPLSSKAPSKDRPGGGVPLKQVFEPEEKWTETEDASLTGIERKILSALSGQDLDADTVAQLSGEELKDLLPAFVMLEVKGYIKSLPMGRYTRTK